MFGNIDVFRIAQSLSTHATARQNVVARNMANADTPGYAARRVVSFQSFLNGSQSAADGPRSSRHKHLNSVTGNGPQVLIDQNQSPDPNGNTVSLEGEMLRAVDIKHDHDRALAIYKSSLDLLRISLGRR